MSADGSHIIAVADGIDWASIELVVFDVDGTLYNQAPLRRTMFVSLIGETIRLRSVQTVKIVSTYRRLRERFADAELADFELPLLIQTAEKVGCSPASVEAVVKDWIEARPLPRLAENRIRGCIPLFAALRRREKIIGVLSDYPARDKLMALGLSADLVLSASEVGVQKPNPRGLEMLIQRAGTSAERTVLIGDRVERDGIAAERAGTSALIRSRTEIPGWQVFADFTSAIFDPLFD